MSRSFAPPDPQRQPAFVARPPVGEEGAAYARVRRYLWADEQSSAAAKTTGEGDHEAPEGLPAQGPSAPSARRGASPVRYRYGGGSGAAATDNSK